MLLITTQHIPHQHDATIKHIIQIKVQEFTDSLFKPTRSRCASVKIGLKSFSVISIQRLNRTQSRAIVSHGDVLSQLSTLYTITFLQNLTRFITTTTK